MGGVFSREYFWGNFSAGKYFLQRDILWGEYFPLDFPQGKEDIFQGKYPTFHVGVFSTGEYFVCGYFPWGDIFRGRGIFLGGIFSGGGVFSGGGGVFSRG